MIDWNVVFKILVVTLLISICWWLAAIEADLSTIKQHAECHAGYC